MRTIEIRADDKLASMLERRARSESKTLEVIAAEALRAYAQSGPPEEKIGSQRSAPYRIRPFVSGKCFLEDLSSTAEVLARAEGEDFQYSLSTPTYWSTPTWTASQIAASVNSPKCVGRIRSTQRRSRRSAEAPVFIRAVAIAGRQTRNIRFEHLSRQDGLSQVSVICIL